MDRRDLEQVKIKSLLSSLIEGDDDFKRKLKEADITADLNILLHKSGLTQAEAAKRMGVSGPWLSKVLSGSTNPTIKTIYKLVSAIGYTFDIIYRKKEDTPSKQKWEEPEHFFIQYSMDKMPITKKLNSSFFPRTTSKSSIEIKFNKPFEMH